jgi:hypothetical protein
MASMGAPKSFTDILADKRKEVLARARERGAAMQKYLVAVNGGGLIATFSLVGVFVSRGQSPDIFTRLAWLFAIGIIFAGVTLLRAIQLQHRTMDKIDELMAKLKKRIYTDEQAEDAWKEYEKGATKSAKINQYISIVGFAFFIFGIEMGIYALNRIELSDRTTANPSATPDRCLSVSIRVHPCQMITLISIGRSLAGNGERW